MLKIITLSILCFTLLQSFAQDFKSIQGNVYDSASRDALEFAYVYIDKTSIGTATNVKGEFLIKIPSEHFNDSLRISYMGYKSVVLSIKQITQTSINIPLSVEPMILAEVILKDKDPVSIIKEALASVPINYNQNKFFVTGFQRESIMIDGHYIQLLESVFETSFDNNKDVTNLVSARYVEDRKRKDIFWNSSRGGFYTFGWSALSGAVIPSKTTFLGISSTSKSSFEDYYDFDLIGSVEYEDMDIYEISFDQKQGVKKPLVKGVVYIDSNSKAIVKLEYTMSDKGIQYLDKNMLWSGATLVKAPKKVKIFKDSYRYEFKKYDGKWYLKTMTNDTEFEASISVLGVKTLKPAVLKSHSEKIITSIDSNPQNLSIITNIDNVGSVPTFQNFLKLKYESYESNYSLEGWEKYNYIKSDTSLINVVRQLKANNDWWTKENVDRKAQ